MNTIPANETPAQHDRPIGSRLRTIDHLIARRMRESIAETGLRRGDGRLLRLLATEPRSPERLREALPPRPGAGPRLTRRLGSFLERGWIRSDEHGILSLTEAGRAQHEQLRERMREFRASLSAGISPEDWQTTLASLEAVARNLGGGTPPEPCRGERGHRGHRGHRERDGHGHGHEKRGHDGHEMREQRAHRGHDPRPDHSRTGRLHRPDPRMPLCDAERGHGPGRGREHERGHGHGGYRGPRER